MGAMDWLTDVPEQLGKRLSRLLGGDDGGLGEVESPRMEPLEARQLLTSVSIVASNGVAREHNTEAAAFTASRDNASGALMVSYSITFGTASAADLNGVSGSIYFADGSSSVTLYVSPVDDSIAEPTETFQVSLVEPSSSSSSSGSSSSSSSASYTIGSSGSAWGVIIDDDVNVTISNTVLTVGLSEVYTIWTKDYYGNPVGGRQVNVIDYDEEMIAPASSQVTTASSGGGLGSATITIEGIDANTDGTDLQEADIDLQSAGCAVQDGGIQIGNPRLTVFTVQPITVVGGKVQWGAQIAKAGGGAPPLGTPVVITLPNQNGFAEVANADNATNANGFAYAKFQGVAKTNAQNKPAVTVTLNGKLVVSDHKVAVEDAVVEQVTNAVTIGPGNETVRVRIKNSRGEFVEGLSLSITSNDQAVFRFGINNVATDTSSDQGIIDFLGNAEAFGGAGLIWTVTATGATNQNAPWNLNVNN